MSQTFVDCAIGLTGQHAHNPPGGVVIVGAPRIVPPRPLVVHAAPFPGMTMTSDLSEGGVVHMGLACSFTINGRPYHGAKVTLHGGILRVDDKVVNDDEVGADGTVYRYRSCQLTIDGDVTGNVTTTAASVHVAGNVKGNVTTTSGDVKIGGSCTGVPMTRSGDIFIQKKKR